ncbi:MAG: hypothetical protein HQL50_15580, partial [Magnetococcales bacterium]|nr:hypothetical protein [Magnetococcales bacterium]
LRVIEPDQRAVTEIPPGPEGFRRLTGIALDPARLFQALLGLSGGVDHRPFSGPLPHIETPPNRADLEGVWFHSTDRESVRLRAPCGLLQHRHGWTSDDTPYRIDYQWKPSTPTEGAACLSSPPPMPKRLDVRWGDDGWIFLKLARWKLTDSAGNTPFRLMPVPADFTFYQLAGE